MRIGLGYDVHKLVGERKLILGGVTIPFDRGLLGHSDADVLIHAVMDSILGALALGDIGKHFPDTSQDFKDISSITLLQRVCNLMKNSGYRISNLDCVIVAQKPKLAPFIDEMRKNIAGVLDSQLNSVNVKATTTEELGFEGRKEGISAHCICLLVKE